MFSLNSPQAIQEICRLFITQDSNFDTLTHPDLILHYMYSNSEDIPVIRALVSIVSQHGYTLIVGTKAVKGASAARRKRNTKFFCRLCAADFTTKGNAQNHAMAHFRLRFQFCSLCKASFGTSLSRHLKTCCKKHPHTMYSKFQVSPITTSYDFLNPSTCTQDSMALISPSSSSQNSYTPIDSNFYIQY